MKVLITGGYGFIGSFVARRFFQEGCEVTILDNLSTGDKRNVEFKHKCSFMSIEDRNCEELFRNNRFEVVVHLAAHVNVEASLENPRLDTQSNVLGLSNMLALSQKYGVKKFIFASSADVYGGNGSFPLSEQTPCNPGSPYGLSKWVGEAYCEKWHSLYGLETLSLRLSNVYGPRQGNSGDAEVIPTFMDRLSHGKELTVFEDGKQTRDFIYVEDVAEAIYRASNTRLTGIYNLSTGREVSVNQLIDILHRVHGHISVSYKEGNTNDCRRSVLDSQRLMRDLDWAPMHDLEEGISKTYYWYLTERLPEEAKQESDERSPSLLGRVLRTMLPYAENLIAFLFTAWLTFALEDKLNLFIDFRLFYIIILGIIYGNRQSIIAVALSCILFTNVEMANGREFVALLYDTEFFFRIAVYLLTGLVVGYSVDRRNFLILAKNQQLELMNEKYAFLNEVYHETRLVKEELQQQIMNNGDSFGKIYSITKELESLEPEKIFSSTVSVVESIMKSQSVSIYTVNKYGNYLRLAARSKAGDFDPPKSLKVDEFPYIQEVLREKRMFVNKKLGNDTPILSAPVVNNGEVVAVVSLHKMKFEHFTLYYQNLFSIIVDLISSALSRAFSYVVATGNQRYIEGTPMLKQEVFTEILRSKQISKTKHGTEFVLLTAGEASSAPADLPERISRSLRETDYIGIGGNGHIMVLLSNSNADEASFVLDRFQRNGIQMAIMEEGYRYV